MTTDILGLKELTENQSAKYLTHNEALRQIEALFTRVLSRKTGLSEISASAGDVYIINAKYDDYVQWSSSTSYSIGDIKVPTTNNGYRYKCIIGGTSDSGEPTWPTTIDNTVVDGGVTWECDNGIWPTDSNYSTNDVAHYYSGAWHFYTPVEGISIWCIDEAKRLYYNGSSWTEYTVNSVPPDFDEDPGTTSGLTWGHKTGKIRNDNAIISVSAGTISLTGDATNYVEVDSSGTVSANTSGFTSGSIPIRTVITSGGSQTSSTDERSWLSVDNTAGDALAVDTVNFNSEYDNGTVSSGTTIDWSNGNNQKITLGASITLTFSNMGVGHKQLKVIQDGTGSRIPTLPSGKWPGGFAGSFSTSASSEDILSIYYDGSSYYYQLSKGWA